MEPQSKSNMEVHEKEGYILISINPGIYPLDVIYSAAYVFLDRAYLLLDGDPKKKIIVEVRPKEKTKSNLQKLGREFNNELINYAAYKEQSKRNASIRQAIVQRALLTSDTAGQVGQAERDLDYLEDPDGIAVPWEEKYGKKAKAIETKESKAKTRKAKKNIECA